MTTQAPWPGRSSHEVVALPVRSLPSNVRDRRCTYAPPPLQNGNVILVGGVNGVNAQGISLNDVWSSSDEGATWV